MSQSVIFQYLSAGSFDVTVPSGFSNQVLVYAWGAGGGTGTGAPGGGGGYAAGVVTIDAGDSVVISVGGAGGSIVGRTAAGSAGGTGNNPIVDLSGGVGAPGGDPEDNDAGGAGGGGGASAIFVNGVPMLVAAGAGGGGGLGEDWGGGDYENGKGRPGGVATQVTTTPRGANGRKGGAGGAGGGGGGYPFGGDSQRNLYGDDVYSISQGGFGGQNYANATVTSSSLVAGSGINPGGTNNGFYPGKSRGKATFDGCVIVVFQKLFTAWIKQSGAWKQVTNAYVKTGNTTLTTTRTVAVSPGTTVSTVAGSQNIIGIGATNWTVPSGVTSLSIVAIGGGGGGGSVGTTTVPIAVTKTVNYTTDLWTRSTNNELIAWIEGINISSALVDSAERASYLARLNTAFDSSVPVGSIIPTSTLATLKSYFNSALNTIFDSYNSDINKLISLPIYVQNLEDGAFGSGTSFTYESNIYTRSTSQGAATFTISIGTSERTLLANELKSALGSLYTSYSASSIERAFIDGFIAFFVSLVVDQFNGISSSVTLYNYTITPLTGGAITTVSGGGGGGSGGVTTGTLAVTPGEVIRVDVGSGGAVSGAATVVRATSGTITASGGGKGSAGTASAGGAGGSTATGGSIGSTGGYSPTGGTVAGGAGGSTSRGYGNGGAGASNTTAASAGASGAVLISYTQSIITTGPSTTTVPVTTTVSVGGWKQIVRGWMKKDGVWKDISTPLTLESSRVATTPSTRARINIVIASNTTSYNLLDTLNSLGTYYPGYSDITLTINAGVVVDSDSAGGAALTVDGLTSGDSLIIVNNGTIRGRGGAGGASAWLKTTTVGSGKNTTTSTSVQPAYPGGAGGTGLAITYIATLENNGNIYAGGGGGGGGGISYNGAGGGQGGGGAGFGPGANAGTATTGGAGSGNGGAGGSNGANGTAGTNGATVTVTSGNGKGSSQVAGSAGGAGGIGGKAIVGYAKLTVTVEGTIVGPRA